MWVGLIFDKICFRYILCIITSCRTLVHVAWGLPLLLLVMTEPFGLACLSDNLGFKNLISLHFCCGKGKFWNYIILSLSILLHNIFLENHMFQYMRGNHKSIAQSRIYCNPWYPSEVIEVLAWALGKSLQWHWRLSSSRWGWMREFQLSAALAYPFGMGAFRGRNYTLHFCFGIGSADRNSKKDLGPCVNKSHFWLFLESKQ